MKKEERLFAALGAADPGLLERSERKKSRKRPWLAAGLAAAACAAVVLTLALMAEREQAPIPPVPTPDGPTDRPVPETLRLEGLEVGDLHLCQIRYGPARVPDFVIYVNEDIYTVSEADGATVIRPIQTLPEGEYPPIDLTITHRSGVAPALAAEQAAGELADLYPQTFSDITATDKGYTFTVGTGINWNDACVDVTCVSDRQGGSFLLTARYFMEAAEGHGVRFRDMAGTFQVAADDEHLRAPDWMNDLRSAADRLTDAFFADRMEQDAAELLADGAWAVTYGEDVSGDLSIAAVDYVLDDDQAPTSAIVSVKHRISTEESYTYLTMELVRRDDSWFLNWAGLEK